MKTIVIDAGHGGYDSGATAFGREEKNDNLALARLVAEKLRAAGQNVILTRNSDIFIPLTGRAAISNRANADLFISLHRNSYTSPLATGIENYVTTYPSARTVKYAETVLNTLAETNVTLNRGVKREDFSVLRNTNAPAQLLEVGFLSSPLDNALFDKNIDEYATAIANGILQALGEKNTGGGKTNSSNIKEVQSFLNNTYGAGLVTDGIVGSKTKRALTAALQTELNNSYNKNLVVDGIFGSKTKDAIPNMKNGTRGNMVKLLQSALILKGYPLALDGDFGANTAKSVTQYQSANNLYADGIAGKNTFEKLFSA